MGELLESSDQGLLLSGFGHSGWSTITVWWADGRATHTSYRHRWHCHDQISGNAHPWNRWEIRSGRGDVRRAG